MDEIVLRVRENETLVTGALSAGQLALLERYADALTVGYDWKQQAFTLTAKQSIGVIVAGGLRIHIEPKVPLTNLFYMLTYAYELAQFRDEVAGLAVGDDLFAFLVEIFIKQVDRIVRQGIHRGYVDIEENAAFLRGRLLLAEHLRRNVVEAGRFHQRANEFTADLLENRVLKHTLWLLSRVPGMDEDARRRLRRTLSAFSEVAPAAVVAADGDAIRYNRLNERYRTPVNLARLFLQHLSLEGHAGETAAAAYLIPMYRVFELFVARYLREQFAADPLYEVAIQESIWLDADQRVEGRPDIVLRRAGQAYAILDTKYKVFQGEPNEADRNQMFMYCGVMGVQRATLIYADEQRATYRAHFPGMTLEARTLKLDGPLDDFRRRARAFAEGFAAELPASA